MLSIDSHQLISPADEESRLREWLDLDQAGDEIGLIPNNRFSQNFNNPSLFLSHKFCSNSLDPFHLDHSSDLNPTDPHDLDQLLQTHTVSVDPSTIMAYPPLSPATQSASLRPRSVQPILSLDQNHRCGSEPYRLPHQADLLLFNPHGSPTPSSSTHTSTPSYALDPSLVAASIPAHPLASTSAPLLASKPSPAKVSAPSAKEEDASMHSPVSSPSVPPESASHKRAPSHPHALVDVPEWADKPSAEEYKLLSSKEKRQLRNKISARNFRHRRKEHISALEQQVAARDETIECLCRDLSASRLENKELRTEVEGLKQKWVDLMRKIEEMSTPAASPSSPPPPASPRPRSAKTGTLLAMPNLHKDLGSHSRKPFNGVGGMAGGNVGVHTTLIPEMAINVYQEPRLAESVAGLAEAASPQALMERKHALQRASRAARPSLSISLPPSFAKQTLCERPSLALVTEKRFSADEVGHRLGQMIFDALKGAPEAQTIDEDKLRGCLEGRLELVICERSPPPYFSDAVEALRVQMNELEVAE